MNELIKSEPNVVAIKDNKYNQASALMNIIIEIIATNKALDDFVLYRIEKLFLASNLILDVSCIRFALEGTQGEVPEKLIKLCKLTREKLICDIDELSLVIKDFDEIERKIQ